MHIWALSPVETIQNVASAAGARAGSRVWSTHIASETLGIEQTPLAAGVMMVPLSQHTRDCLLFFRREFEHTLNWAGNPNKAYSSGPLGERLTPRKSFAIWKETVRLQSRKWTETQHEVGEVIRSALVEIVLRHNEIIAEERGRADLRQRMLNEELNHRVKNILAVIKSLIGQGSFNASTIEEYLETLRGRIQALAVAHDQIVRGDGGGLIRTLLAAELKPYDEQSATVSLSGPAVWVDNSTYSVLALVFHELATNAAKYGALSVPSGQLAVRWQIDQDNNCEIFWEESGGPYVIPPTRKGFGSVLISRSIPHELGGKASLDYLPTGLEAEFMIPSRHIALADPANEESAPHRSAGGQPNRKSAQPTDVAIFLVEDQMLIAMDAEMMLSTEGLRNFRTASSVTEALSMLDRFHPTVAVLDVNLGDETSIPIAAALRRMNVPFLFATGYGDGGVIPEQFQDVPVIRKPYASSELAQAIFGLLD
ncbi:HWE histidine kinase domain-containing protein [Rhizobium sp. G21]|uniref:HWE histidine kinase domain-containing protein n=1 Tax=Rhizobium sp. G21 TaxID=2758439 RepID=UPI0028A87779|nr:HWE histidine kinase domain-containing protein [Rhizobium sp. G21]